jgi:hypothetical protein
VEALASERGGCPKPGPSKRGCLVRDTRVVLMLPGLHECIAMAVLGPREESLLLLLGLLQSNVAWFDLLDVGSGCMSEQLPRAETVAV